MSVRGAEVAAGAAAMPAGRGGGTRWLRSRLPVALPLAVGIVALMLGGAAGLSRIGLNMPLITDHLIEEHGVVLVLGFLGTLIALERAAAIRQPWAFAAPILTALGAATLMAGLPLVVASALTGAGMLGLVLIFVAIARLQWNLPTAVLLGSSVCALAAALLWGVGVSLDQVVPWLAGFLILAIVGERLDLARFTIGATRVAPFVALVLLTASGIIVTLASVGIGSRLAGVGILGMVAWLVRHDIARRTVRRPGIARFSAVGLLFGYLSLALAALAILYDGDVDSGRFADIAIHGVFVGFAISMVMAHAPVIGPSILRLPLRFTRLAYLPLLTLQASLGLRYVGDIALSHPLLVAGAIGNAVAILGFVAGTAASAARSAGGARDSVKDLPGAPMGRGQTAVPCLPTPLGRDTDAPSLGAAAHTR